MRGTEKDFTHTHRLKFHTESNPPSDRKSLKSQSEPTFLDLKLSCQWSQIQEKTKVMQNLSFHQKHKASGQVSLWAESSIRL